MMTDKIPRSTPILRNDLSVAIPDDEAEIFKAVRYNDLVMLRNLLKTGVDFNVIHTGSECMLKSLQLARHIRLTKYCPLIVAVIHSQLETIEWLVDNGASVNITEGTQRTPLHLAVATGRPDVVQYLISKGADLNCQTKSMRTPLLEAVDVNSPQIVKLLIDAGADLDLSDIKGTTPLLDATFRIVNNNLRNDLNMEIIKLLIDGGCTVNKTNNLQATPLMMAVGSKSTEVVDVLLNAGADINHVDNKKRTAFHLVAEHDKMTRMALQLLNAGADMNTEDSAGKTPVEKCLKFGLLNMVKFLLHADCKYDNELVNSERMKYLCNLVPAFGDWIRQELGTVKPLQRLCRMSIRNNIPTEQLKNIQTLDIPKSLINYLMYNSG